MIKSTIITSTANSQVKNILKLFKSGKTRREQQIYIVEGIKMFLEAEKLGIVKKAYLSEELFEQWSIEKADLLDRIDYEVAAYKVFKEITETVNPQGVIALVHYHETSLEDILNRDESRLLLLDNLRDPGNLGTIVRTAEGAGITGIILSKESVDIYNPKVVRATMGSAFRMPHVYVEDFAAALNMVKEHGVKLYATHLSGKQFYDETAYAKKFGIIIGNEANGISEVSVNAADCLVKIPMCGKVESLNAAVASSIMIYEAFRQRRS